VNHTVELSFVQMDKELFLGAFLKGYQSKNLRDFTSGFPSYEGNSDLRYLLTFYSNVVNHCATFGIYVPPLHTLRPGLCYGIWFDDLFPETQSDAATTFPQILRNALLTKHVGLKGHEKFGSSLMHETDGYKIMFRLAVLGQHPMLVDYPALPRQPRQTDSQTLPDYVADWMHFLHIRSLDGMHYSDRYFLQQFCENMHRNFSSFVHALNDKIAPFNSPGSINHRAPPSINPEAMLLTLQQHAMQKHKPEPDEHEPSRFSKTALVRTWEHQWDMHYSGSQEFVFRRR
jgi:hypothetical protein